jgi:hypothetical protein
MLVDGAAAHQLVLGVEAEGLVLGEPVQHALNLRHHFGADAVAGQDQQFLVGGHLTNSVSRTCFLFVIAGLATKWRDPVIQVSRRNATTKPGLPGQARQ